MNVGQVIELAREWVEVHGSQTPGFCGAHLMGGLNSMPKNTLFPAFKDADLNIVLRDSPTDWPLDISYKGLILECGRYGAERYRSPEVVLSDPELASNLVVDSILSDPTGMLASLHSSVAQEYSRRKWVLARCQAEKNRVRQGLQEMIQANSPIEALINSHPLIEGLTGLIAVASLKPPTHRRCLILTRVLLEEQDKAELQEEMLRILGFAHLNRTDVETYLQDCGEAFDRAVRVTRTPVPGGFKLHSHVRPYVIQGAQEMLDEGYHREAMYWVWLFLVISNGAIQMDAHEGEKRHFQTKLDRLLSDMGWSTLRDVAMRHQQAKELANDVFRVADSIVDRNPEVVD